MGNKKKRLPKTRDHLMVKVINGVTKAGAHRNHKKETAKYGAREKVEIDEDILCKECAMPLDEDDPDMMESGFCSPHCAREYQAAMWDVCSG